jgi:hypothetical protein
MARPVALACTTLGLAGLLLATLPATPTGFLGLSGGAAAPGVTASAPERDLRSSQAIEASPDQGDVASPAGGEGPAVAPVVPAAEAPAASSDTAFGSTDGEVVAGASKEPVDVNERPADAPVAALDEPGPSALAIASAGLLVIGLLMLGLVFVAGRRHPGSDDQA